MCLGGGQEKSGRLSKSAGHRPDRLALRLVARCVLETEQIVQWRLQQHLQLAAIDHHLQSGYAVGMSAHCSRCQRRC